MSDKLRRKKEPTHVRLYASITASEAWKHLSGNAVKVLLALVARDNGTRNGNIGFSCREASAVTGIGPRTCWRCFLELQEKGFIACTQKGGFSRKVMHATLWRYTWVAWPGGRPAAPTRDFEKWRCPEIRGCRICNRPVAESDESSGNALLPVAETTTGQSEKPVVSANPHSAETTTLIVYQAEPNGELETEQWKQANPNAAAHLGKLRDRLIAHLQDSEAGEQSRLADDLGIPTGTLSKFKNGSGLPNQYREALTAAVGFK